MISGQVLEKPPNCPPKMYEMMLQCCSRDPDNRPTFGEIVSQLKEMIQEEEDSANHSGIEKENFYYWNVNK